VCFLLVCAFERFLSNAVLRSATRKEWRESEASSLSQLAEHGVGHEQERYAMVVVVGGFQFHRDRKVYVTEKI